MRHQFQLRLHAGSNTRGVIVRRTNQARLLYLTPFDPDPLLIALEANDYIKLWISNPDGSRASTWIVEHLVDAVLADQKFLVIDPPNVWSEWRLDVFGTAGDFRWYANLVTSGRACAECAKRRHRRL